MYLRVRVKTNRRKEELTVTESGLIEISLKEKPERNMANKKLMSVISTHLSVPIGKLKIMSGHKKPSKIILVGDKE